MLVDLTLEESCSLRFTFESLAQNLGKVELLDTAGQGFHGFPHKGQRKFGFLWVFANDYPGKRLQTFCSFDSKGKGGKDLKSSVTAS